KLDTTTTLDKLLGISTISYHMNNDTNDSPLKVGFSAQQLEIILPDLVVTGADGYKSVSYAGLTPYLVAGMQAQQQTINSLKQDIQTLQAATGINSNQVTIANLNVSGPTTLKDLTVTGNLNITGSLTLAGTLTVKDLTLTSNLTIGGHIITAGNTPTITPQAAAGQGATATIEGNDTSGVITIVAGSDATIGDVIDTTFAQQFGAIPKVTLTPVGPDSAKIQAYISSPSAGSFKVGSVLAPTAGTTYTFNYQIMQ
ncbi:MAG: hypothetical protein QG647_102, partial [Patescibacteria group bacterium]|nr:hypothetical protein [Patescibacteria group bacterium]